MTARGATRRTALPRLGALGVLGTTALGAGACNFSMPAVQRNRPVAPLADRQVLRLALGGEPETLDPARVSYVDEIGVVMRVFSNLLALDASGALVPDLAERLPVISPDGRRLTFGLRPGLVYSDGTPLRASDFIFSWRRHATPPTGGHYAFVGQAIEGVRALDDRTVEFSLKAPAPWFLSVLTTWCGVPLREDVVSRSDWTEPPHYIGCGPYVMKLREPGNRIVMEANPRYHRGPPTLTTIELSSIGDPAVALAAYRNDELDVLALQREDLTLVQQEPALRREHRQIPAPCTTFLAFNTSRPPYSLPGVRRAFSLALDRGALVSGALGGAGAAASQLVPPGLPGHYREAKGQRRDLPAARRHLAQAGYADPTRLPAVHLTYAGGPRARGRADAVVEQLRQALGIEAVSEPMESHAFTNAIRSSTTAPGAFLSGWCQDYPDPQSWYSALFHSRSTLSGTGWSSPELDRMLDQADAERDPRRRDDLYRRASELLADDAPVAFLFHDVSSRLVKPWVHGLTASPLELYEGQMNAMALSILKH